MALQEIIGNEKGTQFIDKLNSNFAACQGGGGLNIKMERGGLKPSGAMNYTIDSFNGYVRSSMLIKVNDATKVVGQTLTGFTVYEYGNDFAFIKTSSEGDTFGSSTKYIKIAKETTDVVEDAVLLFDGTAEEVYNVQIEKGTSSGHLLSEMLVFEVDENICTTARLLLPSSYSISGKKVPLIIWNPCDGSFISWGEYIDKVGSQPNSITTQLQYLTSNGFAVLEVYLWGSYHYTHNINSTFGYCTCGSGSTPVPVTLRAMEKAVEYVTSRFNVSDTNIFEASWSGAGKLSAYYAIHKAGFNLRHIYAFSPVVDGGVWLLGETLGGASGYRAAVNSEMKFDDDETLGADNYVNSTWGGTLTFEQKQAAALAFRKKNAGKFIKFLIVSAQNLVGAYMKNGALHQYDVDDKVTDSLNWGVAWRIATGYTKSDGTTGTDGSPQDSNPFNGWDELSGMYDRHDLSITSDGSPITIIGAKDDAACPYLAMEQFIIQLRNGGAEAKIIALPNGSGSNADNVEGSHKLTYGHRAPIFYNLVTVGSSKIPYGWWYMVQDIKSRYLKQQ